MKHGASISIGHGPRPSTSFRATPQPKRHYELWLDEIDELVGVILEHTSINPGFVLASVLRAEAREFLAKENKQPWSQLNGN